MVRLGIGFVPGPEGAALAQALAQALTLTQAQPVSLVWVTGWMGTGKSTTGDYLAQECGFAHVDVDDSFMMSAKGADAVGGWYKSWGAFFGGGEPAEEDFGPFLQLVCEEVLALRAAEPGRPSRGRVCH
jgi:hypothetical protein